MNNTFTNIILVVVLVLIVGFGVWYFTRTNAPEPQAPGVQLNVTGGSGGNQPPANSY